MQSTFGLSVFAALFAWANIALAQSPVGPNGFRCTPEHPMTGQSVPAMHMNNPNIPFWAMAQWLPNGVALISYSPGFYALNRTMQRFTQHHECGHLSIPTSNEFEANCFAIERMDEEGALTEGAKKMIRQTHCSIGALGPQYGGSGRAFWNGTVEECSQFDLDRC